MGNHPVLTMCALNAVVDQDPAGNRKMAKDKSSGRIDGAVALAMALRRAKEWMDENPMITMPAAYEVTTV